VGWKKSQGKITIYYNGSTAIPQTAGKYQVTFDVAKTTGWEPAERLDAGTLVINTNPTPGKIEYYWVDQHDKLVTTNGGAANIASGSSLAITAQGAGFIVKQWYLNGINTGQTGNTYNFSSATAGKHTVSLFVEKDGKLYNTNITITVQ